MKVVYAFFLASLFASSAFCQVDMPSGSKSLDERKAPAGQDPEPSVPFPTTVPIEAIPFPVGNETNSTGGGMTYTVINGTVVTYASVSCLAFDIGPHSIPTDRCVSFLFYFRIHPVQYVDNHGLTHLPQSYDVYVRADSCCADFRSTNSYIGDFSSDFEGGLGLKGRYLNVGFYCSRYMADYARCDSPYSAGPITFDWYNTAPYLDVHAPVIHLTVNLGAQFAMGGVSWTHNPGLLYQNSVVYGNSSQNAYNLTNDQFSLVAVFPPNSYTVFDDRFNVCGAKFSGFVVVGGILHSCNRSVVDVAHCYGRDQSVEVEGQLLRCSAYPQCNSPESILIAHDNQTYGCTGLLSHPSSICTLLGDGVHILNGTNMTCVNGVRYVNGVEVTYLTPACNNQFKIVDASVCNLHVIQLSIDACKASYFDIFDGNGKRTLSVLPGKVVYKVYINGPYIHLCTEGQCKNLELTNKCVRALGNSDTDSMSVNMSV